MERTESGSSTDPGRSDRTRYKLLTLGQVRSWKMWHDPGKDMGSRWDDGERVYAFEDGSVHFREGGGRMQGELKDPDVTARWKRFLEKFNVAWH